MRTAARIICIALSMLWGGATHAMEPEELSCGSAFDTPEKINQCLTEALAKAETDTEAIKLNLLKALGIAREKLQAIAGSAVPNADAALEKSQSAWREFRDANCGYYQTSYAPISSVETERLVCQLRMVRQRWRELEDERRFWVYKFRDSDGLLIPEDQPEHKPESK